ncbi:MAG: class I SAM-dependent methyltransferase [Gammaproteobacteria bacterium]|jgi:ubiquinone/menaquinone biosynthesis C-methylase UbiE
MNTATEELIPELETIKQQLKTTWCAGNYADIAKTLEHSALDFLKRHPVKRDGKVLDVACGSGQVAIPAARAGAEAVGVDIADNLIDQARDRAAQEGLNVQFDIGDAEMLPYEDNSFDQVYSVIGAMFAPRPERVAEELKRVCKPGGEIIMANWTPEGFVGHFFKTVGKHAPPPAGMPSPLMWGQEQHVRKFFGSDIKALRTDKQYFEFRYTSPVSEIVDFYRQYFGPVNRAFARLDKSGQDTLRRDLKRLWSSHNQATDGTIYIQGEVLEIVANPA